VHSALVSKALTNTLPNQTFFLSNNFYLFAEFILLLGIKHILLMWWNFYWIIAVLFDLLDLIIKFQAA